MGLTVTEKLIATSLVAGKMNRRERIGIHYMSPEDFGKYWGNFEAETIELIKPIKD